MTTKRPIIDQVKEVISNREQIRSQINENFNLTKKIVEAQAQQFLKQTKESQFLHDRIIPLVESEKADKALDVLGNKLKLKDTLVMKRIEKMRRDLIDLKVAKAKNAEPTAEVETVASREEKI